MHVMFGNGSNNKWFCEVLLVLTSDFLQPLMTHSLIAQVKGMLRGFSAELQERFPALKDYEAPWQVCTCGLLPASWETIGAFKVLQIYNIPQGHRQGLESPNESFVSL